MKKILTVLLALVMTPAFAEIDKQLVDRAEKYLNGIAGMDGDFTQKTSDGQKDSGKFSLMRPGKIRLDYKKAPIQLISDGDDVYFYDQSLDQITTIAVSATPASVLVRKTIDLTNADLKVVDTKMNGSSYDVTLVMRENPGLGKMTVTFDLGNNTMLGWVVNDATGLVTTVNLKNLKTVKSFPKNFFELKRQKTYGHEQRDSYYD